MRNKSHIILTIDVEDWFQVENFKPWIPFSSWGHCDLRVEKNIHRLLDLFDEAEVRGQKYRRQKSEIRGQRSENRNQKTGIRRQRIRTLRSKNRTGIESHETQKHMNSISSSQPNQLGQTKTSRKPLFLF